MSQVSWHLIGSVKYTVKVGSRHRIIPPHRLLAHFGGVRCNFSIELYDSSSPFYLHTAVWSCGPPFCHNIFFTAYEQTMNKFDEKTWKTFFYWILCCNNNIYGNWNGYVVKYVPVLSLSPHLNRVDCNGVIKLSYFVSNVFFVSDCLLSKTLDRSFEKVFGFVEEESLPFNNGHMLKALDKVLPCSVSVVIDDWRLAIRAELN